MTGYRTNEPESIKREVSQLLSKVLDFLQMRKMGRSQIAESLMISVDEINALTFKLTRLSVVAVKSPAEPASGGLAQAATGQVTAITGHAGGRVARAARGATHQLSDAGGTNSAR